MKAIKRNNPGNIRKGGARYKGEVDCDGAFRAFSDAAWGFRAMFVLLRTYRNKYSLTNVRQMLYRYAPPSDGNDTEAYIGYVCTACGITDAYPIDVEDHDDMVPLVTAMARMEHGHDFDKKLVEEGWRRYVN